jgi:iron complex outermembrane receptor protein
MDLTSREDTRRFRFATGRMLRGRQAEQITRPGSVLATFLWIAVTISLFLAPPGWAQESGRASSSSDPWAGVEVMVVLGTEGMADLLTGTASVTAFDAATLETLGIQDISDLSDFTPNLEIVTAGTTSATLFIRGVGLNDFSPVATGAISVYQDDVPRGSSAILLGRIFDVQEVVVARGPQGTGPNRNASAGTIKIYPRQPTGEYNAFLSASYGNYNYVDLEGALEMPLIDDVLSMRNSFGFTKRGGWMKNRCSRLPAQDDRPQRAGAQRSVLYNNPVVSGGASLCGEPVTFGNEGRSTLSGDLPSNVNDLSNWAIRSILKWTPDLSIDTSWSLNLHYSKVRDDSHIGQEIGVQGLQRDANGVEHIVGSGPSPLAGSADYADADILNRLRALENFYLAECGALCELPTPRDIRFPLRDQANLNARQLLGIELEDLDQDPFSAAVNEVGKTRNEVWGFALKGDADLTDSLQVKSITGFERWSRSTLQDLDFTPETRFHQSNKDRGHQISQELRLLGQLEGDTVFGWEIGGLLVADEVEVFAQAINGSSEIQGRLTRVYEQKVLAMSGYVDLAWELTEVFGIDAGARWNYERKSMDYELGPGQLAAAKEDISFDAPTGRVRLRYTPTEDASLYVMYSRGWKAGSYNPTSNPDRGLTFADPERIDALEFGWDLTSFEGRFRVSGAFFYYDYYNYQIFTAESNDAPNPEFVTINANSAQVYGAELETTFEPFDGTNLRVNFGWLESEFLDFTQFQLTATSGGGPLDSQLFQRPIVHTGGRLLNSPQFTVSIIASQRIDLGRAGALTLGYNASWTDDVYFDSSQGGGVPSAVEEAQVLSDDSISEKAYWLHGVTAEYRPLNSPLVLSAWVRNLTNEGYRNFAFDLNAFLNTTIHFIGEPRTFGGTLRIDF